MKIKTRNLTWLMLFATAVFGLACAPPTNPINSGNTSNTNTITNTNTNVNSNLSNVNSSNVSSAMVETKEPEQYQATVSLKLETSGSQAMTMPPLKAEVARNGDDRRMEFGLPNGEKLIYLDKGGKQFVISPANNTPN